MKCYKKTIATYMCLTFIFTSLVFSGCGKSKSGGGGTVTTPQWYQDSDGDKFGNPEKSQSAESQPDGYVDNSNDCNDENAAINPAADEIINDGIDNNCNNEENEIRKGVIPDTGQTTSYTNTLGEDSDYLLNAPSYIKRDKNGGLLAANAASCSIVEDKVTGLMWEMKNAYDGVENAKNLHDADNKYSWAEASSVFIAKLNEEKFGNFNDWRLPTIRELTYITDCSRILPRVSTIYFSIISTDPIWSSTPYLESDTQAWNISLYYALSNYIDMTNKLGVMAVRGQEALPEFETYGSSVVHDKTTGLMWQKTTGNSEELTYNAALEYCENLELGGFSDWRLPNRNELLSLIKFDRASPSIDKSFFPDTQSGWYWTSTTFIMAIQNYNSAWMISFNSPELFLGDKLEQHWVRAVRGGRNAATLTKWFLDSDDDGYGDPAVFKQLDSSVLSPAGYVLDNHDCNDADKAISPAEAEIADDGIDQNCTGIDMFTWYNDIDNDGFGNENKAILSETKPASYIHNSADIAAHVFDCDDTNTSINPDMDELSDDGIDNDCNGLQSVSWYVDSDNDGFGDGQRVIASENPPVDGHYATNDLDCNDSNSAIHPGIVEIFGNISDSNCNGDIDDETQHIVPDTGQIASYTGTPGEDGDYLINPPSYTKIAGNGDLLPISATEWTAVRDNVTGLYWEVKTTTNMNAAFTFANAVNYAGVLELAGYSDWRLPTVTELASIANLDLTNPAIDPAYFPNVVSNRYWTSTSDQGNASKALTLYFQRGASDVNDKSGYYFVIAVRGGQSLAARLIANGDGTVTDTETGLMWNDLLCTSDTWNNSVDNWSSGAVRAGYNDWRLPTESDMKALLDVLEDDNSFDLSDVFENVTFTGSFWTSALAETDPAKAIVFSFLTGETDEMSLLQTLKGLGVRGVNQSRFITNDDGTVLDSKTGLMWMRENSNNGLPITFESALAVCNTLSFANYDDWRMPNRNEMLSLLAAYLEDSETYSSAFPDSQTNYWTSSSCVGLTNNAWQISFETGSVSISIGPYTNPNVFRAVRGGNPE